MKYLPITFIQMFKVKVYLSRKLEINSICIINEQVYQFQSFKLYFKIHNQTIRVTEFLSLGKVHKFSYYLIILFVENCIILGKWFENTRLFLILVNFLKLRPKEKKKETQQHMGFYNYEYKDIMLNHNQLWVCPQTSSFLLMDLSR